MPLSHVGLHRLLCSKVIRPHLFQVVLRPAVFRFPSSRPPRVSPLLRAMIRYVEEQAGVLVRRYDDGRPDYSPFFKVGPPGSGVETIPTVAGHCGRNGRGSPLRVSYRRLYSVPTTIRSSIQACRMCTIRSPVWIRRGAHKRNPGKWPAHKGGEKQYVPRST